MDFTINKYRQFLAALQQSGLNFHLRHDVDLLPENSLRIAKIEAEFGLKATYYFRMVPESYDSKIIKEISSLGHEIGYHYESLTTCDGDIDKAYRDFCSNLEKLRQIAAIRSICMHGSPKSKWDSKDIWKKYDYKVLGIDYEPYFDTDFSRTFYLTDTGRRWDGYKVSVRDNIPDYQQKWNKMGLRFHSTDDIINMLKTPNSPLRQSGLDLLITTHPQRWSPFGFEYIKEYLLQSIKNSVKYLLVKMKNR